MPGLKVHPAEAARVSRGGPEGGSRVRGRRHEEDIDRDGHQMAEGRVWGHRVQAGVARHGYVQGLGQSCLAADSSG